jgi:lipopolysaccharide transport system permease protein
MSLMERLRLWCGLASGRRLIALAVSFGGACGMWTALRWQRIPGTDETLQTIPLGGKVFLLGIATALLFGMARVGALLIRDARLIYDVAPQHRLSATGLRWFRYLNPAGPPYNLYGHRHLLWQFMRREVESRYRGTYLGIVWSMVHPLLLLITYTFAFSVVLQARWNSDRPESLGEFGLTLFAGLIAFNIFAECVNRAPTLVVSSPNYVRRVVFPLEILPVSVLGAALFHGLVSAGILALGGVLLLGTVPVGIVWLPVAMVPLIGLCLGLSWFLAAVAVYVRDVSYAAGLATQMLFFLTPIFYPIDLVPETLRPILRLNPLSEVVEGFRRVLVWHQPLDWGSWINVTFVATIVLLLGYTWFMKTKTGFADVI